MGKQPTDDHFGRGHPQSSPSSPREPVPSPDPELGPAQPREVDRPQRVEKAIRDRGDEKRNA